MGAWGPGLFSNDITCDVRDSYIERLALGLSDVEAEEKTIIEYQEESEEKWIALAVIEWRKGRLSERVKALGIAAITNELKNINAIWEKNMQSKRRKVLMETLNKLNSPLPVRKMAKLPSWSWKCPWQIGSVLQYKITQDCLLRNEYVLLQIVGISETPKDKIPCETIAVGLYNWHGSIAPINDREMICSNTLHLISFISRAGIRKQSYTIMPGCDMRHSDELECISKCPLPGQEIIFSDVGNAMNSMFDETICRSLLGIIPEKVNPHITKKKKGLER